MSQWDDPRADDPTRRMQPAYGQQQRQPGRYGQPPINPFGTEGDDAFGIVGMVLGLLGGVVLIVSFTAVEWFSGGATFSDVHDAVSSEAAPPGFAAAYFSWFAWLFLVLAVGAAVASSFPSPALRVFRVLGVVAGFAAAGLSFLAIQFTDSVSYLKSFEHARVGFYFAVIGFALAGIGAAIGPRKV